MASGRSQIDWFLYQAGMLTFRAFAQGKATWILNYSWDGDKVVDKREAMKNLAMSQVVTGSNFWDAPGHCMAGSNDLAHAQTDLRVDRRQRENSLFAAHAQSNPSESISRTRAATTTPRIFYPPTAARSSRCSRRIVNFRSSLRARLGEFKGKSLVLPNVTTLNEVEKGELAAFSKNGGRLIVTGADATGLPQSDSIVRFKECPAKSFFDASRKISHPRLKSHQPNFLAATDVKAKIEVEGAANRRRQHIQRRRLAPHLHRQLHRSRPRKNCHPDARLRHPNTRAGLRRRHARIFAVSGPNSDAARHAITPDNRNSHCPPWNAAPSSGHGK